MTTTEIDAREAVGKFEAELELSQMTRAEESEIVLAEGIDRERLKRARVFEFLKCPNCNNLEDENYSPCLLDQFYLKIEKDGKKHSLYECNRCKTRIAG